MIDDALTGAAGELPGPPEAAPEPRRRRRRRTRTRTRPRSRKRPVEMLPTLVTLGNLFSGFLAIAYLTDSQNDMSAAERVTLQLRASGLIFLAMVFDAIDGKIARMMGQTTKFGEQVDSICDAVSFGAAPALLAKVLCEMDPAILRPKYALVLAVIFLACAVIRLARFNVETEPDPESHRYFKGLPTPGAAAVVASLVYLNGLLASDGDSWVRWSFPVLMPVLGALMVSRIRYVHVAGWLFRRKSFPMLILLVFIAGFVVLAHEIMIPALCVGFMLSGPARWLWLKFRRREPVEPWV